MSDRRYYKRILETPEKNIAKVGNFRTKDNELLSISYMVVMKNKEAGINCSRYFDTLKKAQEFKQLIIDFTKKVKVTKSIEKDILNCDVLEYPENILKIIGVTPDIYDNYYDDILPNFDKNLEKILPDFGQKEKDILLRRFKYFDTLEEIGKFYNVTRERIRQIEAKTIHRLKGNRAKNILTAKSEQLNLVSQQEIEKMREQIRDSLTIEEAIKIVNELGTDEYIRDRYGYFHKRNASDILIADLRLSYRSKTALRRSNIETIDDLIRVYPKPEYLYKIRNVGKGCVEEITKVVQECGYIEYGRYNPVESNEEVDCDDEI